MRCLEHAWMRGSIVSGMLALDRICASGVGAACSAPWGSVMANAWPSTYLHQQMWRRHLGALSRERRPHALASCSYSCRGACHLLCATFAFGMWVVLLGSFSRAFWVGTATAESDAVVFSGGGRDPRDPNHLPEYSPSFTRYLRQALLWPCPVLAEFSEMVAVLGSFYSTFPQLLAVPRDPRSLPT